MAIRKILRFGNGHLYSEASLVTQFNTPELHQLIEDLHDTMLANEAVGIAAPQIGIPLQVAVFGFEKSEQFYYADPIKKTVLINPSLKAISTDTNEDWEDCLSAAGIHGLVTRFTHIQYSGYDQFGNFFNREAEGFHARLVQHEYDHLFGKIFISKVKDYRYFGFEEELREVFNTTGSKLR